MDIQNTQFNVDENDFFRQATLRICGSLNIQTALENCFEYLRRFIPLISMRFGLFDPDLNLGRTIASVCIEGEDPQAGKIMPLPEVIRAQSQARWAAMERIAIINRPGSISYHRKLHKQLNFDLNNSLMIMRLEMDNNRLGALGFTAKGTDQYTEKHTRLALLLHDPFAIAMANALQHQDVLRLKEMLVDDNQYLSDQLREISGTKLIGSDFGLKTVTEKVRQVAHLDSPVLLMGETGVGKEVIANVIHYASSRKNGPFIKVNCGAISEHLIDSELFGHEKGAFTGAIAQKRGRFERAQKGTIFLDEVGELPPHAQVRLLHVLQNKEIERVGGTETIPVDIRVISATNRNLQEMVVQGRFREDLWFRLNLFPIMIPPLRIRKEDIPALVHHFLGKKTRELKLGTLPKMGAGAIESLMDYDWPGNVRELENVVERALIQNKQGPLYFDHYVKAQEPERSVRSASVETTGVHTLDYVMVEQIRKALEVSGGRINGQGGAAELLGIIPNTLRKKMDKLGVPYGRRKGGDRS
jgi:transcriptional regulator with GAF, ATPase, and Fis domain